MQRVTHQRVKEEWATILMCDSHHSRSPFFGENPVSPGMKRDGRPWHIKGRKRNGTPRVTGLGLRVWSLAAADMTPTLQLLESDE
jgi:hypothetical protein